MADKNPAFSVLVRKYYCWQVALMQSPFPLISAMLFTHHFYLFHQLFLAYYHFANYKRRSRISSSICQRSFPTHARFFSDLIPFERLWDPQEILCGHSATYLHLFLIWLTTQSWETAWGNTSLMVWIKPVRISIQAIRVSYTPGTFRSVRRLSQKEALSVSLIHMPRISYRPSLFKPIIR